MGLRHIGEQAGALASRIGRQRPVGEPHVAGLWRQEAEQRLQQRGLAAAVRAEQRQHLARRERDVEAAADHVVAVADRQRVARERHG